MQRNTLARSQPKASSESASAADIRKYKAIGTLEFLQASKVPYIKTDVYRFHGFSPNEGKAIDRKINRAQKRQHSPDGVRQETRGRKSLINWPEIHAMERIIESWGNEGRELAWKSLAEEAGLEHLTLRTVQRAMGTIDYFQCIICKKGYVNPVIARQRVYYSEQMLLNFPNPEDWKHVRFGDEVHFGYGKLQSIFAMRKPGQRFCASCVGDESADEHQKRTTNHEHGWIAAGYDFKSEMRMYDTKAQDGKMSQDVYVNQILEPVVKPWLQRGDAFLLEEEPEFGHGSSRTTYPWNPVDPPPRNKRDNVVQQWKRDNGLQCFFNCHESIDLTPLDLSSCWKAPRERAKDINGHFSVDQSDTRALIIEGWDNIPQEQVNEAVLSIPQRLRDCITMGGQLTMW